MSEELRDDGKISCDNCGRLVNERELDENWKCRFCEDEE